MARPGSLSRSSATALNFQVSPAVRLTPNLQDIIDPDQLREPFRPKPIPDVFVVGAKLSVDLFTVVGFAKGPRAE